MDHYNETEELVGTAVGDDWSFERVEAFIKLTTGYDDARAFEIASEMVHG
jgi:hypothetical protein